LSQTRTRAVGEFSKGMQRRIGLAQALINDPDLVLLDEPTSGLDPIGCREVKDLILALARRGKTVILSSHLLSDVEDVCDRVVIYYGGRIQAMGTLKDLLAQPDSIRITTPALPRDTMHRVLDLIRRDVAEDKVQIDTPTQNLESYFLQVVHSARQSDTATSGATSGARVAAYLRGEAEEPAAANKILERLAAPLAPSPTPAAASALARPIDQKKLDALAKPAQPTLPEPEPATTAEQAAELAKANEKLATLLSKPKSD